MFDSLEEKNEDRSDQSLKKKPEDKTKYFTPPLLEEGNKDKKGGGEGEKVEVLRRIQVPAIQGQEIQVPAFPGQEVQGGRTEERIEANMGNICSALKPPKKVRKRREKNKLSLQNNVLGWMNCKM